MVALLPTHLMSFFNKMTFLLEKSDTDALHSHMPRSEHAQFVDFLTEIFSLYIMC